MPDQAVITMLRGIIQTLEAYIAGTQPAPKPNDEQIPIPFEETAPELPTDLIPIREAAAIVHRSTTLVRGWVRAGLLPRFLEDPEHPENSRVMVSKAALLACADKYSPHRVSDGSRTSAIYEGAKRRNPGYLVQVPVIARGLVRDGAFPTASEIADVMCGGPGKGPDDRSMTNQISAILRNEGWEPDTCYRWHPPVKG